MDNGGSALGGSQTASGGADAFDSTSLKISHDRPKSLSVNDISSASTSSPAQPSTLVTGASPQIVDTSTSPLASPASAPSAPAPPAPTPEAPSPDDAPADDIPITEAYVIKTSDDTGTARLFGQDISGITDEDLGPGAPINPAQTVILPSTLTPVTPEPIAPPAPNNLANSTSGGVISTPRTSEVVDASTTSPQPQSPFAQFSTPQPTQPYEQQFLEDLRNPSSDIVFDDAGNRPKKALIFGLIAGTALICIIGLVAIFAFSGSNKSTPVAETYDAAFYTYANDILYGTSSSAEITDQHEENDYHYNGYIFNGPGFERDYFDKIYQEYTNFYSKLPSSNPAYELATDYKSLLDFLQSNPTSEQYSKDHVVDAYLEGDRTEAQKTMTKLLSQLPQDNHYSKEYRDLKQTEYEATLQLMDDAIAAECIIDGEINYYCASGLYDVSEEPESSPYNIMSQAENDSIALLDQDYNHIGTVCWQIKTKMQENN